VDEPRQQPNGDDVAASAERLVREPSGGAPGPSDAVESEQSTAPASGSDALDGNSEPVFATSEVAGSGIEATPGGLPRSASLTPTERVVPTWTDPTVRRASEVIGGPLGRHALVGRAPWLTPLRVCLLMAIVILIGGWLFKAACIQQGPNGAGGVTLDQSGQRPWLTACYNDVVPLYGSHKLDTQAMPYKTSWTDAGEVHYMEYPVVTGYFMWAVSELAKYYNHFAQSAGLRVPLDVATYFTIGTILLALFYLWAVASTGASGMWRSCACRPCSSCMRSRIGTCWRSV